MRRFLAGILSLFALIAPLTLPPRTALARNEVEAIGFGSLYRPNTYVPLLINVSVEKSGTYQIRVVQEDLDRDAQIFKQDVTLTGADEGKGSDQKFWMYFIPQPTDGGLPDTTRGGTLRDLQQQLKVFLCDEKGKQIMQLPVTQTILNVENAQAGPFTAPRGTKLVLAVSDGAAQPIWRDYQQAIGTMEDTVFVSVRSFDLPEDVRGFEMVDAIVWLAAPLPDPAKPSDEKRYRAIDSWVRAGGHLVVCQPAQRDATLSVADLLPVEVKEVVPKNDLEPLRTIATERIKETAPTLEEQIEDPFSTGRRRRRDDWSGPQGPFMFAHAQLKPGGVSVLPIKWTANQSDETPYIARIGHGLGCVTWVAHDLSDPTITNKAKAGWPYVWDRVLDFKHDLLIVDSQTPEQQQAPYKPGAAADVGYALLAGMELSAKSRALVSIAVVFFIAYWVVAGPGVYFYLLTKAKPQFSWFMFAFSAVVATVLTVLVVKLVVRGPPEMHHVTVVRGSPNEPNVILSRFGLYIPRDGTQAIELGEVAAKNVSYVNAYAQHPAQPRGDVEFPAQMPYLIHIHDASDDSPVKITVPYRSTLKQFMARVVAAAAGGSIQGSGKLREDEGGWAFVPEGLLTNATGHKLRNVYIAYHRPAPANEDWVLYLPTWEKGQTINLDDFKSNNVKLISIPRDAGNIGGYPEQKIRVRGAIGNPGSDTGWSRYWFTSLRTGGFGNTNVNDLHEEHKKSFPVLSLFGRLPPMKNQAGQAPDRVEVLRRGARNYDMSSAVAAGRLVVLAEADGQPPVPFDLKVEGTKVDGKGTLFYQFALPMERIPLPPTTQPSATQPTAMMR